MTIDSRIKALSQLGKRLQQIPENDFDLLLSRAKSENAWFTNENIKMAWQGITKFLSEDALINWIKAYRFQNIKPKTIALVMAGNIPLVGFHDLLCTLIAGHSAQVKASSKDSVLIRYIVDQLHEVSPDMAKQIVFVNQLKGFDAVIATGSDNSSRYFEYYFEKYPHIIRKNRTSCAVLTGKETSTELQNLGVDIFSYFGLGCRNISKIYVPAGFDFTKLLDELLSFKEIIHHHKYCNNYDYQKSIMLVNKVPFLDSGMVMLTESEKLVSPISVIHYEYYKDPDELIKEIELVTDKIQCIVGSTAPATIPFGQAQFPELTDYADQIDTLQFLIGLN